THCDGGKVVVEQLSKVTLVGSPHVWGHNCVAKAPLWEFQHGLVRIRLREKIQTRQLMLSPGGVPTGTLCWLSKM
ncbi:unnamed protein product, partial [Cladocopium goreaui]